MTLPKRLMDLKINKGGQKIYKSKIKMKPGRWLREEKQRAGEVIIIPHLLAGNKQVNLNFRTLRRRGNKYM